MSHTYPLARDASDALSGEGDGARTREEARARLDGRKLVGLKSDWLTLSTNEADAQAGLIERGVELGFVQRYEDASGNTVLAITFWAVADGAPAPDPAPPGPDTTRAKRDHTDDLYFRSGRTKPHARKRKTDPNQLDLFETPGEDETENAPG